MRTLFDENEKHQCTHIHSCIYTFSCINTNAYTCMHISEYLWKYANNSNIVYIYIHIYNFKTKSSEHIKSTGYSKMQFIC